MSTTFSNFYTILEHAVQIQGHDLGLALQKLGISPPDQSRNVHLSLGQIRQIWSVAYQLCGDPLLGCSVIPYLNFNNVGTLDLLNVASASRQEIIGWGKAPFNITQDQGVASGQPPSPGSHR